MITVKIGKRGQITIPRDIRRNLGLKEGDKIALISQGDRAILQPITKTLLDLKGSVPVKTTQDFEAIRQHVVSERARKQASHER